MWEALLSPAARSSFVAAAVYPAAPRAPRQVTRRRREAGFLASGSPPSPAFPVSQWHVDESSPVTVAGAAKVLNLIPYTLHLLRT